MKKKIGLKFCFFWNTGWGIFLLVGLTNPQKAPDATTLPPGKIQIIAAGFMLASYWVLFIMWLIFGREMDQAYQTLTTSPPSPAQIQWQLSQELGRPPTLVEVAAVHQMLVSDHNQQLIQAAETVGGLLMLHNAAERARG